MTEVRAADTVVEDTIEVVMTEARAAAMAAAVGVMIVVVTVAEEVATHAEAVRYRLLICGLHLKSA